MQKALSVAEDLLYIEDIWAEYFGAQQHVLYQGHLRLHSFSSRVFNSFPRFIILVLLLIGARGF